MADFKKILKTLIEKKEYNTPTARQNLYNATKQQLHNILDNQGCSEEKKQQQYLALEKAIHELENEYLIQQKASVLQLNNNLIAHKKKISYSIDPKKIEINPEVKSTLPRSTYLSEKIKQIKSNEKKISNKQRLKTLLIWIGVISLFLFFCIYTGWRFLSGRNRIIFNHEIINTKIDPGIDKSKFSGRLINKNNKKHNAPVIIQPVDNTIIPGYYDKLNKAKKITSVINQISSPNAPAILSTKINVMDSETNLQLSIQKNQNKDYNGKYILSLLYNDDNYSAQYIDIAKTKILLHNSNAKAPIAFAATGLYNPALHLFIFSFENQPGLQQLREATTIECIFNYKDGKSTKFIFGIEEAQKNYLKKLSLE